jgi:hypothetical protein
MMALNQSPPPAITCSVVRDNIGNQLRFRGRLVTPTQVEGSYSLRVKKIARSGSSVVSQPGTIAPSAQERNNIGTDVILTKELSSFTAAPNKEPFVGLASFNQEANARYDVQLTLQVGGQTHNCK